MDVPVGKADGRCSRGKIHGRQHPVGLIRSADLVAHQVQIKAGKESWRASVARIAGNTIRMQAPPEGD